MPFALPLIHSPEEVSKVRVPELSRSTLAYHFEIPMLVTKVGALADTVPDGKVGVVVDPTADAIAKGIETLFVNGIHYYAPHIKEEKKKYSWTAMADHFIALHQKL
jgi:glycosyltransferase involved in cell wall biosynthesis